MWALRARPFAILALLLVTLPLGAVGADRYFCRMAGRVMESCCCASAKEPRASSPTPGIQAEDCCQLLERASRDGAPALRDAALRVPAAPLATVIDFTFVMPERPSLELRREPAQARAPPRAGPSLFLQNCSLLI